MMIGARALATAGLLLLAGAARAVPVLEYQSALQGEPALRQPVSVSIDPASLSICVTDEATQSINVFDPKGYHRFRTDATSNIRLPRGACIDAAGDFVYTDTGDGGHGRAIRRLNFLGEPQEYHPQPPRPDWRPENLALMRNGDYVTLDRTGLLCRHSPSGELAWSEQIAEKEWEGVELLGPPVEMTDGAILVPGAYLRSVIRISADGQSRRGFGVPGTKRGEMAFPVGVAVGPDGHVLVVDRMRHKVLIYDEDFQFLDEFGRLGYRPGDFYFPLGIAASPDGRVFISQGFEGRVQIYRLFDTADVMAPTGRR